MAEVVLKNIKKVYPNTEPKKKKKGEPEKKSGLKITIDVKRGTDPDKLMRRLYKMTPLEESFPCNFNVLIAGMPKVLGVKDLLLEWIAFREECVRRRVYFDLQKAKDRLHLLQGLEKILLDIDKAIKIVRETEEEAEVVPNLMIGFGIDEIQAEYVAEIKLRHLNREFILKRLKDVEDLQKQIEDLENSGKSLENVIKRLESDMKKLFSEAIEKINAQFGIVFTELFGGGNASIVITDEDFPVATARMYELDGDSVMIGRVVVLPEYRHQGLGSRAVTECERWAREEGYARCVVESRDNKVEFYEKLGVLKLVEGNQSIENISRKILAALGM